MKNKFDHFVVKSCNEENRVLKHLSFKSSERIADFEDLPELLDFYVEEQPTCFYFTFTFPEYFIVPKVIYFKIITFSLVCVTIDDDFLKLTYRIPKVHYPSLIDSLNNFISKYHD